MPDLKLANQKYKRQLHFRHRIAKMKFPFRIKHENEVWIKSRVFTLVSTKLLHSCSKTKRALLNSTRNGCNFISWHIYLQQYKLDEALFLCSTSEWANRHHDLCSMKIVNAIHSYKYIIKYWYWNHNLDIRRNKWNNLIYLPI